MSENSGQTFVLPDIVDLDALDDIGEKLLHAIEDGPVAIEASKVERVATNSLLMLLSAAETARRSNFAFSIEGASAPMLAAVSRLGLDDGFAPILKG
jgi:anti-anti-sigma regulatory factor